MGFNWLRRLGTLIGDRRGAVSPLMTLLLVPVIGAFAVAGETGAWYVFHRSQQNAADSSVIAAAEKGSSGYLAEAKAVASEYGYTDGKNNVAVTPTTVTCPSGASGNLVSGSTCYQVTVSRNVPLLLAAVVGYSGDTTVSGGAAKTIAASATAGTVYGNTTYCLRAGQDITLNGGSGVNHPNFNGCSMVAGNNLKCNGSQPDYGVLYGDAAKTNGTPGRSNTCGQIPRSNEPIATDAIAAQVTNALSKLSPSSCPSVSTISTINQGGVNCFSPATAGGSISLASSIDVTGANTVIVIKNGGLNLGAFNLQTAQSGSSYGSLTLVFQGTTQSSVITSSGGNLNIGAPTSGDWSGIAIAEDPSLVGQSSNGKTCSSAATGNGCPQDLNFSGTKPNLYITGAIYAPNATLNVGGAINKATAPFPYCIAIDAKYIITSGNLTLYNDNTNNPPTKDCRKAGLDFNTVPVIALLN